MWAFLPASASATYSHTVSTAALTAVRTVLALGANSPDAARHLVAWLAAQHGHGLIRDVADELATELAEASAVTAGQGTADRPAIGLN